jgi:hypothetical protein
MKYFYPTRKSVSVLFIFMMLTITVLAQPLTGVKTIDPAGSGMNNYLTFKAAVDSLNLHGVGSGGVTFNVAAGATFNETGALVINASGTAANQIVFQKSGAGASPVIYAAAGTIAAIGSQGSDGDAVIRITGGDYITFDGISLKDSTARTGSAKIEYGFYFQRTETNASKNITIKNCDISLDKTTAYSTAIYFSLIDNTGSTIDVTSTGGRYENISIQSNTISNSYSGIYFSGFDDFDTFEFYDHHINIGNQTGNSITDFGGGANTSYGIYVNNADSINIRKNTINNNFSGAGTGTIFGIYLENGENSSAHIDSNTVTVGSARTSGTSGAIYNNNYGAFGTNNFLTVNNNNIQNCAFPNTTSGATYYIRNFGLGIFSLKVNGNKITANNVGGAGTATGTVSHIDVSGSTSELGSNWEIKDNLVYSNTKIQSSGGTGGGAVNGISCSSSGLTLNIFNNTVRKNTFQGTGTMTMINSASFTNVKNIYNNTIDSMVIIGNATVHGIQNGDGIEVNIYKNKINDFVVVGTTPVLNGLNLNGGTTINAYNNFISDLKTPTATGSNAIRGINANAGTNLNITHNTVYLNASSSGTGFGSSGINSSTSVSLNLRNNIVVNKSVASGSGRTVAHRRSGTSLSSFVNSSNNNIYYTGVPSSLSLIHYDGTNIDSTLAQYKLRVVGRESVSGTEDVPFVNGAASPYDLHINPAVATQVESGGIAVASITTDFDGTARNATTPDIGADEGTFTLSDLQGPSIAFTLLPQTASLLNRTLSNVIITDASGVNTTAGTKPRLYFRQSSTTNSYIANSSAVGGWKYVEANGATSPFDFTIDYSLFNTPVLSTDTIEYFIVAQDNAGTPNVSVNAGALTSTSTTVALTGANFPVTSANSYRLRQTIAANVTVGSGGTYTSLTGPGGLFQSVNDALMSQNVTASIISNLAETGANALNPFTEEGAGNYHLRIIPSAASDDSIIGNFSGGLIRLNGADRVTFDGSFGGAGRHLIFVNNNTGFGVSVFRLNSLGTNQGSSNDTIQNCQIIGGASGDTWGISVGSSVGSTGEDNNNVHIAGNLIKRSQFGIFAGGESFNMMTGLTIVNNEIGAPETETAQLIRYKGIQIGAADGAKVSGNKIYNILSTNGNPMGIDVFYDLTNSSITKNNIVNIRYIGSFGYGAKGIAFADFSSFENDTIANNFVTYIGGDGWSGLAGDAIVGIRLMGSAQDMYIYNNTVNLFGKAIYNIASTSAGVYINSGVSGIRMQNNIVHNSITNPNNAGAKAYAFATDASFSAFTKLDNNNYSIAGAQAFTSKQATTDYLTLASHKNASAKDSNSYNELPVFIDSLDLHINTSTTPTLLESKGATISINTDIDGDVRPGPAGSVNGGALAFDIGADEFDGVPNLSDVLPPVFTLDSVVPSLNTCLTVPHVFHVTVTDASGVDSVIIFWSIGLTTGPQPPVIMTRVSGDHFSGSIPSNIDSIITYSFRAVDSSVNHNAVEVPGGTYKDQTYVVQAHTVYDTIALGSSTQLTVTAPFAANIGNGTLVNGNQDYPSPYAQYYWGDRHQFIIPASELLAEGITAGPVTGLAFDVVATNSPDSLVGYEIRLGSTSDVDFSSGNFVSTPLTTVFSSAYYKPVAGKNEHTFSTPYIWDGVSSIVIETCNNNTDYTYNCSVNQTATSYESSIWYREDALGVCTNNSVTGTDFVRPNIQLTASSGVASATWTQPAGGGLSALNVVSPIATPTTAGTYTYNVTGSNGLCSANSTVDVVVVPAVTPVTDFVADTTKAFTGAVTTIVKLTDLSTNYPDHWKWTFTPSTVTYVTGTDSSKNPQVEFNAPGLYSVRLISSNSAGADTMIKLDYITVEIGYCTSGPVYSPSVNIGNLTIYDLDDTTKLLDNGIAIPLTGNGNADQEYTNYYDSTNVAIPALKKGNSYSIDITGIYRYTSFIFDMHTIAYIDFNHDGDFYDAGEQMNVVISPVAGTGTGTITIPCDADTGIVRMRIIGLQAFFGSPPFHDPCGNYFDDGETEDYKIRILENPLSYVSSNTSQLTRDVLRNTVNQPVIQISVVGNGCGTNLPLTQFNLNSTGTTSLADISNAKIWYTGNHKTFADTSLFGTATPAASFTITGNKNLIADTNYFWLTYDVNAGATLLNYIDGGCVSMVVNGTTEVPATVSPVGSRQINIPAAYISSSATQYTGLVFPETTNNTVLRARINMSSTGGAAVLTKIKFATTGSTDELNDLTKISLYYTGSSNVFSSSNLIDTIVSISDTIEFIKNVDLTTDSNYFWLTYDISPTATIGNFVDGEFINATIEGNIHTPVGGNPSGRRKISEPYCIPVYSTGTGSGDYISYVKFGSIIDLTGPSPDPYHTLTPYSVFNANFQQFVKDTITLSAGTYSSNDLAVWIDYNQDGIFSTSEKIGERYNLGASPAQVSFPVRIPITALLGITRMRVREADQGSTNMSPCDSSYTFGEVQDYEINILPAPPGDYYPPDILSIGLNPDSQCTAVPHTITAQISDTTGVDSAWVEYTLNGSSQTPITMVHGSGNTYTAVIPASGSDVVVYSVRARDNSSNQNEITIAGDTYQDEYFSVSAGDDKFIAINQSVVLAGNSSLDHNFRITEFTLFDGGTGNQGTWPAYIAEHDDNIEVTNLSNASADLSGYQLITEGPSIGPQTFTFPPGTNVPANGVAIVHFGFGTPSIANNYFVTGTGSLAGSGTSFGIVLKDASGDVNDAVAVNTYTFSGANGVTAIDWSGSTGVTSPGGISGAGLYGADVNDNTNWVTTSASTLGTVGAYNTGLPTLTSNSVLTWTGGLFTSPQTGSPVTTPVHTVLGVYQYIVTASNGVCTTKDTIDVHVVAGPTVNLGPDGEVCLGGSRTLDAGNPGSTYKWRKSPSATVISTDQTLTITTAGTYKVEVTNPAGLMGDDSIVVAAGPAYVISLGADRTVCSGGAAMLDPGNVGVAYLWSTGATTQSISVTTTGEFWVTSFSATGCEATDTIELVPGIPPVVNLGADLLICASDPALLDAGNPGATYLWNTGATTQTIQAGNAGTYIVTVTQPGGGCSKNDTVAITNKLAPVADLGTDQEICAGTSAVLTTTSQTGVSYLWSTGATTPSITVTTPGSYWLKVTLASTGCSTRDTVVITNKPAPVVNLGLNPNICPGDSATLDAGNPGSTYLWSTGATTQTITAKAATNYSVIVTGTNGCQGKDTVTLTYKAAPTSHFTAAPSGAGGLEMQFNVQTQIGVAYAWNFGDNTTSSQPNPKHLYTTPGSYTVTLTVTLISTGCKAVFDSTFTVNNIGINNQAGVFYLNAAPNPFNDKTTINFDLMNESQVTLEIYDMIGKKIAVLAEDQLLRGEQHFMWNIESNNTGTYFVRLTVDGKTSILQLSNVR